jgi:hypothetical protein
MRQKINRRGRTRKITYILLLVFQTWCFASTVWIDDAWIMPEFPTDIDEITISVSGEAGKSSSYVSSAQFYQDQDYLTLDLYVDMGNFDVISSWTHDEPIGVLSPDYYALNVRAYDYRDGTLQDEYTLDFTVTPEPSTLFFLGIGLLTIKTFSRRKG